MRQVQVSWAGGAFAQDIVVAGHRVRSDEPLDKAGEDTGPSPHEFLLASLGACTAMTLKMYAQRKGWPLADVHVTLNGSHADGVFTITRALAFEGELDPEQRQRLIEIADKCPVHKTLLGDITIRHV